MQLANDSFSPDVSINSISTTSFSLDNVLFIHQFSISLLSISQIIKTLKCLANFYPSYCQFQNLLMKKMIGDEYKHGDLCFLDEGPSSHNVQAFSTSILPF